MSNKPKTSRSSCAGVTLLDVAVALVIVSLLFIGAVRGSELISSAHTKRIGTDISNVTAAFLIYQDRYRSIPGDDAGAAARWEGEEWQRDGVLSGLRRPAPQMRPLSLWIKRKGVTELLVASSSGWIIDGPDSALTQPPPGRALGGQMGIRRGAFGCQPVLCFDGIAQQMASTLDRQIDDGQPGSGSFRAGTADGNLPTYQLKGSDLTICVSLNGWRAGLPDPLYPPSAGPGAAADGSSAAPQSVAPGSSGNGDASGNGQQNGQNGTGPGNNGNGNGNGASGNANGQINGNGQHNGQNGTGPGNNGNGNNANREKT